MKFDKFNTMKRGAQQALYKYLPECWVDFTLKGGATSYSVHVDNWNSIQLTEVNAKRLLRVVSQQVNLYRTVFGENNVIGFPSEINESTVFVLTPKASDINPAINTSVDPLLFVCNSCGNVKQFYNYSDFRKYEYKPCDCGKLMTQLKIIKFCKCGHAEGIRIPKCQEHGTRYIKRKGNGWKFYCSKCGKPAYVSTKCPECRQQMFIKNALDSSHYLPFNLSVIDLLDTKKDEFLDNEIDCNGEKVIVAQYIGLVEQSVYSDIISQGKIIKDNDYELVLQKEEQSLREGGLLDESVIRMVIDAKRANNPSNKIWNAINRVNNLLSIANMDDFKALADQILEYDQLINAKEVISLQDAEITAESVRDGIKPDYSSICRELGFSKAQFCSGVPLVFCAYGYTRKDRTDGVRLHGFPQEMEKKNVYATRLETEGVLFELDRSRVIDWLKVNNLVDENDLPVDVSESGLKTWFLNNVQKKLITTFNDISVTDGYSQITKHIYTLIHSISHALIAEVSEICGLDKGSLSEYIMPNIPAVFVYCSNSQGFRMGALSSAFQTQFDRWLNHAKKRSKKCIFDPVCITKEKACAGCLFLNEVSCQHFNKDLDRSYLCGYFDSAKQQKLKGYWE